MKRKKGSYSVFDHTADIGIEVEGASPTDLYEAAAAALFDVMFHTTGSDPGQEVVLELSVEAEDAEQLLVRWLSELLFLYDTRGLVMEEFAITELSGTRLKARVGGRPYDGSVHALKTEVKAITYHDLTLGRTGGSWRARFVIDV
jgi:SHS2 domain-containing protein